MAHLREVRFRIFAELGQRYGVAESAVTERMRGVTSADRQLREELRRDW